MLVGEEGICEGLVSGGCLEKDVLLRAGAAIHKGRPTVIRYDSIDDEEEFAGFRLGCRGIIDILIEPITSSIRETEFAFLRRCRDQRLSCVIAKVIGIEGRSDLCLGGYLLIDSAGEAKALQSPPPHEVIARAQACLQNQTSAHQRFSQPDGQAEIFFEFLPPPTPLLLFGTGPDVSPLLRMAKELGLEVTIVDPRGTYLFPGRFTGADAFLSLPLQSLWPKLLLTVGTAAVIMTHHYPLDLELLDALVPSSVSYLGVLGPRHRTDRLLSELIDRGRVFSEPSLQKFYAPVGLDLGTETPEAIALSILAEIQAVLSGREGGFLRTRIGPIHGVHR
jgi:xanthine dehydrogenase accessory factor